MRLTTDFWVSALTRRVFGAGGYAAVVKRGATEAGAVFVLSRDRMGQVALYGPAPQASYESARPDDRFFTRVETDGSDAAAEARLAREQRFDPDVWIVEIEPAGQTVEELLTVSPS